ncbi:hypothetical protein P5F77_07430 [Caldifermentibacillus hisashii]|uniref:hypothetical protein n=1 Tax=Caldifermentibacillus hisashii TaxID=996558 RepID=UPI0030D6377A
MTTRKGLVAKNEQFRLKTTTRKSFVAKKGSFAPQNDDEKGSRRQKMKFPAQKRRRERVSSPKKGVSRLKMTTRKSLVAKKSSSHKIVGESKSHRQK